MNSQSDFGIPIISDVVEGAADLATSAVDRLPGGKDVREAVKDFAKTGAGKTFFRALATVTAQGLLPYISALASVAFAIPGFAEGDDNFDDAWMTEFKWRLEQTGAYFGDYGQWVADVLTSGIDKLPKEKTAPPAPTKGNPGDEITGGLNRLLNERIKLASDVWIPGRPGNKLEPITESPPHLARRFKISVDSAEMIISAWNHTPPPDRSHYKGGQAMGRAADAGTLNVLGRAKGAGKSLVQASTSESAGPSVSTLAAIKTPDSANTKHESQKESDTTKRVALPLGGMVLGAGGAFVVGLALPAIVGVGALGLGLGWLLGRS